MFGDCVCGLGGGFGFRKVAIFMGWVFTMVAGLGVWLQVLICGGGWWFGCLFLAVVFLVVVMLCCLGSVACGRGCGCFPWVWWLWVGCRRIDFQVCVVGGFVCLLLRCWWFWYSVKRWL